VIFCRQRPLLPENLGDGSRELRFETEVTQDEESVGRNCDPTDFSESTEEASRENNLQADSQDESSAEEGESKFGFRFRD
jgi:hypothetical protein